MSVDQTLGRSSVQHELETVVSMLSVRFPERSPMELEQLVHAVYQHLSLQARIRTHLIPLTLNRSRRLLIERRAAERAVSNGSHVHPKPALRREAELAVAAV